MASLDVFNTEYMHATRAVVKWLILTLAVLILIIGPFLAFGAPIESWTKAFLRTASEHRLVTAGVLSGLLATDILLPIPSSIVSTAAGFFLGLLPGALVSLLGMTISCVLGYGLGYACRRSVISRMLGDREMKKLQALRGRMGDWVVVGTRAVPVLAEAAVLFVGMGRMRFSRFFLMSLSANLAISFIYAAVGATSASFESSAETLLSFLLAFGGSICLPGLVMMLFRNRNTVDLGHDHH